MINPIKKEKLKVFQEKGINCFPTSFEVSHKGEAIKEAYKDLEKGEHTNDVVSIAGRIMQKRVMGKASFIQLQDRTGRIQCYFQRDVLGDEEYKIFKKLDYGDIIGVKGSIFKTNTGEITIKVESFKLLTKNLADLPEKWHGLKDQELRYRKRFIDLIVNREVFNMFMLRTKFVNLMRKFLVDNEFLEVETPVLEMVPGGAEAKPFITHHNTLDIDLYMRISLELHLKRLMVGGYERVFEIGKVFRNEGMSTQHLQEFTLLEFYYGYINYEQLMKFVQEMYKYVIKNAFGTLKIKYQDYELNFEGEWPKVDYVSIVKEKTGIDILKENTKEKLEKAINDNGLSIDIEPNAGRGRMIDQLYKKYVRPEIIQPTFLINHPVVISPLSKRKEDNKELTERFQILIVGSEVGNGFSELNDPIDQRKRFEEQVKLREAGDEEAQMLDENFLEALEIGMPPTSGFGVGIDRLFMILANQPSIRDVVLFPMMKPEEETKE